MYHSGMDTTVTTKQAQEKKGKTAKRKRSRFLEIMRFVVVGLICTLIDAAIFYSLMKFLFQPIASLGGSGGYGEYLAWGIAKTIAFLLSAIVNFLLSRLWVYQNVDKRVNTKSPKVFWAYIGLAALGWLIGIGVYESGVLICNIAWPDLHLATDFVKVSWKEMWNGSGMAFWAFVIIFLINTFITMVYNYLTRKILIFKEPKEHPYASINANVDLVVTLGEKDNKEAVKKEGPKFVTRKSFKDIFNEEVAKTFKSGQKKSYQVDARKIVREEIESYEKKNGLSRGERK